MLANKLLEIRKSRKEKQIVAARNIGIPCSLLSRYERGTRVPSFNNLVKILKYYEISLENKDVENRV